MLKVTLCVGSSCVVRGSDELAAALEGLIEREKLAGQVELVGAFCMEQCSNGVSVKVGDTQYREIHPEDAEVFFYNEVWPRVGPCEPCEGWEPSQGSHSQGSEAIP